MTTLHDFTATRLDGEPRRPSRRYAGKLILIVNLASAGSPPSTRA